MGESYKTNSEQTKKAFLKFASDLIDKEKYVTWSWRIGKDRSLDMNALFHVWATEYAAHLLDKNKKSVTEGELEGMKRTLKREFYLETKYKWMILDVVPVRGGDSKKDYRSSANYKTAEMFEFMCWMQAVGANDGLILESKGNYAKREREANGI